MEKRKLKRVVVKEELIAITGDYFASVILNQFMFWAERRKDADKFIAEEKAIALKHGEEINMPLSHGWIYKKTEEMADETMIPLSRQTIRRHIQTLIEMGFLDERQNPQYKWDKTIQYRVNLNTINTALNKKGYHLEGYGNDISARNCSVSKMDIRGEILDNREHDFGRAIPEITSKITNKEKREEAPPQKNIIGGEVSTHHSQSQTPASTKGYLDEASVGVVAGKSTAEAETVINYLNQQTGSSHVPADSVKLIAGCLRQGLTVADLKRIVDNVKHWTEDDKNRVFLRPSHLFGKNASELLALPPRKGASIKHSSTSKRQYYLTDPNGNPDAVLVDEASIPVGTDAWDKEGRRIIL